MRSYVLGERIDIPVVITEGAFDYYFVYDTHGSVIAITNATGAIEERYKYDAHGNFEVLINSQWVNNRYFYAARDWGAEIKLYHNRARFYDPQNGFFIQRDPLGYVDESNPYIYTAGNSVNYTDPLGLEYGEWSFGEFWKQWKKENKKVAIGGGKAIGEMAMVARDTGSVLLHAAGKNGAAIVTLGYYGELGSVKIEEISTYSNFYESVRNRIATDTYFFETALVDGRNAVLASNPITGTYIAAQTMTEAAMEGDSEKFGGGLVHLGLMTTSAATVKGPVFTKANWFEAPTFQYWGYKYGGITPRDGTLTNVNARQWYLKEESKQLGKIDESLPEMTISYKEFLIRNKLRSKTRDLMADRKKAAELEITDKNLTWQAIVKKKYIEKGLVGNELFRDIRLSASKSRASVNSKLGLDANGNLINPTIPFSPTGILILTDEETKE